VTRWFGGIKLGAGGLMRAYGGVAAQCLREADKVPLVDICRVEFALGFAALRAFKPQIHALEATVINEDFGAEGATLRLTVPAAHLDALRSVVADLSRGSASLRVLD
jgi:putative IMPACT (imprinted ancient) family translation regulator